MIPSGQPYTAHDWLARLSGCWAPESCPDRRPRHQIEIYPGKCKPRIRLTARNQVRARCRGECELCWQQCGQAGLELHHLHYRTVGAESPWDLLALCRVCHQREHMDPAGRWWNDPEQRAAWERAWPIHQEAG